MTSYQKDLALEIMPRVIAHRGASAYAPENTLTAFLKAKQLGVKWIEFDVQMTADGELVIFHDDILNLKTNGAGSIRDYPLSYLKSLDAGSWFSPQFAGEKIPTLQEVFTLVQQESLAANIEIKIYDDDVKTIAKKVVQLLKINLMQKSFPFFISSFNFQILKEIKKIDSSLPVAHLMHHWETNWQDHCDDLNCIAMDFEHRIVTAEIVQEVLATKRLVFVYTVNDSAEATKLFSWGVSAVFSDCPDRILSVL